MNEISRADRGLTDEEVTYFHENGFLVVRNVVPPDLLRRLQNETASLIDQYREYRNEPHIYYAPIEAKSFEKMMEQEEASDPENMLLWRIDKLDDRLAHIDDLRALPFVRKAMAALLGENVIHYNESFVLKQPHLAPPVPWHQDPSFKTRTYSDPISTMDVYLDDADEENGCIWVVPGSHMRGNIDTDALQAEYGFDVPGAVPVRMNAGDVAFHNNGCLHGSKANRSDRMRRIIYLAFQTRRQAEATGKYTRQELDAYQSRFERLGSGEN
jgi:ectoine hydroxylase-related dioxygenase (phytanoyl-CoA dioxygenase family)